MTHFRPPRWLRGRHAQTVWGSLFRMPIRLPLRHERLDLPDGDFIDLDLLDGPTPESPLVIVCHGLEGSSKAGYVRGLMRDLRVPAAQPARWPKLCHAPFFCHSTPDIAASASCSACVPLRP